MVADEHSVHPEYKNYNRDGKSLQRKYQVLSRTKTPTGDPDIPEHVGLSFDVKKAISDWASISKGYEEINPAGENVDSSEIWSLTDGANTDNIEEIEKASSRASAGDDDSLVIGQSQWKVIKK